MSYFDEDVTSRIQSASSLDEAAIVLSDLLTGGYSIWADGTLYRVKQLVARVKGLEIHVFAREHAPPHFHVKSADVDATFTVDDCSYINGNIDSREQKLVERWYKDAKLLVIAAWNDTRPTDCQVGPVNE